MKTSRKIIAINNLIAIIIAFILLTPQQNIDNGKTRYIRKVNSKIYIILEILKLQKKIT
jgi:hypothetical protein